MANQSAAYYLNYFIIRNEKREENLVPKMKIKKMSKERIATQMNPLPGSDYNLNSPYNITPLITHQG